MPVMCGQMHLELLQCSTYLAAISQYILIVSMHLCCQLWWIANSSQEMWLDALAAGVSLQPGVCRRLTWKLDAHYHQFNIKWPAAACIFPLQLSSSCMSRC